MMKLLLTAIACALALSAFAHAATEVEDGLSYRCEQPSDKTMSCEYAMLAPGAASRVRAFIGKRELAVSRVTSFPRPGNTVAILILVDTSDPGRSDVIARNIVQVKKIVDQAKSHYRIGLARFDSDLQILMPLGSTPETVKQAAEQLEAVGRTTELYRSTLEAVRRIAEYEADRRALFIFSDGLAEDYAYSHEDVVRAAREAGVRIFSMGFPRSVSLSVALQSLRRLSEESGGRFVAASGTDYSLPASFMADPFRGVDSGGRFELALDPAIEAGLRGPQRLEVRLETESGTKTFRVSAELPAAETTTVIEYAAPAPTPTPETAKGPEAPVAQAPAAPPPAKAPARGVSAPAPSPYSGVNMWLWYGTPAAFLLIVIIALAIYGYIWRQRGRLQPVAAAVTDPKPFAYLVMADDESVRYMITQSPWRIGRSRNNDLTLDDHSVSRQHAEIHRKADGSFTISDLDSLNGVFVNDQKIQTSELNEGDRVDIGDMNLRFTLYDNDYAAQEPTVMLHTHVP